MSQPSNRSRPRPSSGPRARAGVAVAIALVPALLGVAAFPGSASAVISTFESTGAPQTWTAPAGATKATFDVHGAAGSASSPASRGGRATATLPVTGSSQEFVVYVGGRGVEWAPTGGFNGGGASNRHPGGGASDVRVGGSALADRVIVAGGGGGGTTNCIAPSGSRGVGGGLVGGNGVYDQVCFTLFGALPGTGGTQTGGGTNAGDAGAGGSFGVGGRSLNGGGGGGGYYGGAGGHSTGEGGGGSGFGPPDVAFESGVRAGDGLITVSPHFPFEILVVGSGTGRVVSSPAGIDCVSASPSGCSAELAGDEVTLQATADADSTFVGWDGAGCSGTADCVIAVDAAQTVRATFATLTPPETEITAAPAARGSDPRPQVAFSTSTPDATFECSLDGAPFTSCTSPYRPPEPLADGPHTVAVRAVSHMLVPDPSPAVASFTIDTTVPEAPTTPLDPPRPLGPPTPPVNPPGPVATTAAVLGTTADRDGRYPAVVRDGIVRMGCSVSSGALASCAVRAVSITSLHASPKRLPKGTVLATGTSAPGASASRSLAARLTLTTRGRAALARRPLGVTARVTVTSRTTTGTTLTRTVLVRLLSANRLVLPVRGHGTALSASSKRLLSRMTRTVTAAKVVTCVADTDRHGSAASDLALTRKQAAVACAYLRDRGIRARITVRGNGHARPRATNRTDRGRALNRRLTITTTY
jgi:hypothetical protein